MIVIKHECEADGFIHIVDYDVTSGTPVVINEVSVIDGDLRLQGTLPRPWLDVESA